ncbi:ATP-binding protein [Paraburkholderia kururiensis]|uniref:AAA family ATPase n=1 Tax=Paraburkholderia kururiensis TaxID=984307 RepID=UPI0039A46A4F
MALANNNGKFEREFTVIFGLRNAADVEVPPFTALIVPSDDKFDDFGFKTRVSIHLRLDEHRGKAVLKGYFGVVSPGSDTASDSRWIVELMNGTRELTVAAEDGHHFFTMLPTLHDYRAVVRDMGPQAAGKLLLALNDLVAVGELRPTSNIPAAASITKVFQKSFVRTAEAYFAFKNAGPILRGVQSEEFGRMSQSIQVQFHLAGRRNEHQLMFRFDHSADLPKRVSIVIGKNGVGKSQALSQIVRALLVGDGEALFEAETQERVLVNRLLAFAPTNESASVFPTDRRKKAQVWYKRFALNRGGGRRRGPGIADLVLQVARSDGYIGDNSRWRIFLTAIEAIADWRQISLVRKEKGSSPLPIATLQLVSGEDELLERYSSIDEKRDPVRVVDGGSYPLSSGEISFVRFAAQASLFVENGSLLLLDEPETHLHPNFISHFVALLNNLLAQTGSAAVVATHSAYFVREVFREQVTVLRSDEDGFVQSEPLRLQTFGADVGSISYFVFGEDEPSKLAAKVEERLLARYQTWDQLYAAYKDELSLEMLGSLRLAFDSRSRDE